jgi:hypothetical protein
MVGLYDTVQRIFPVAFPILWVVPAIVLFARYRVNREIYLCRFPPIDRYRTLDMFSLWGMNPAGTYKRVLHALWEPQDNADLEQLRREMWRSYGLFALWTLGFPITIFGVIILLILTGHPPTP